MAVKPGDVVQLKSGGPPFVVVEVSGANVQGTYYNPITGLVVGCSVKEQCLKVLSVGKDGKWQ